PLPRSYLLPVLLVCAAFAGLLWRSQHAVADLGAALGRVPAETLALISGNPYWIAPQSLSLTLPAPAIGPLTTPSLRLAPPTRDVAHAPTNLKTAPPVINAAMAPAAVPAPLPARESLPALPPVATTEAEPVAPVAAADVKATPLQVVSPAYPQRAMIAGIE